MADEIEAHALGDDLRAAARRAAKEEARHTRMMTSLARSLGSDRVPRVKKPARRRRTLEEIALENAVEGCVRETYGALVATHQATHAEDPHIRAIFAIIAEDETSHAELAWAVAAALERRLDEPAKQRVHHARMCAIFELQAGVAARWARNDLARLGFPTPDVEKVLVRELFVALTKAGEPPSSSVC